MVFWSPGLTAISNSMLSSYEIRPKIGAGTLRKSTRNFTINAALPEEEKYRTRCLGLPIACDIPMRIRLDHEDVATICYSPSGRIDPGSCLTTCSLCQKGY